MSGHRRAVSIGDLQRAFEALEAELAALRVTLGQIAEPSYVGNYLDHEVVEIYRKWAQNALAAAEASRG